MDRNENEINTVNMNTSQDVVQQTATPSQLNQAYSQPGQEYMQPGQAYAQPAPEYPFKVAKKSFNSLGLRLFVGSCLFVGVQFLFALIVEMIWPGTMDDPNMSLIMTALPNYLISMPLIILLLATMKDKTEIPKKPMRWYQLIVLFLITYAGMFISNLAGVVLTTVIGAIKGTPVTNNLMELLDGVNPVIICIMTVICAPIYEEIIFRKLIISRTIKYGELPAILVSAVAFGLYHGNISQTIYATVIGLVFGYIFVRTGKIIYTVILHMCINFMGSVAGLFVIKLIPLEEMGKLSATDDAQVIMNILSENILPFMIYVIYIGFIMLIVVSGVIAFALNTKKIFFIKTPMQLPKGKAFGTAIINVGMILMILFWIGMIIFQAIWG